MKRLLLSLLITVACCLSASAGSPAKRYHSLLTEKGMLYFLNPAKMPRSKGCTSPSDLTFDITYLTGDEDSVSYTLTVVTKQAVRFNRVAIDATSHHIDTDVETVYCEPHKGNYVSRIRFYIKWDDLKKLYDDALPYTISLGNQLDFGFAPRKWPSERETIGQILNIIELSK